MGVKRPEISLIVIGFPQLSQSVHNPLRPAIVTEQDQGHGVGILAQLSHAIGDVVRGSWRHLFHIAHVSRGHAILFCGGRQKLKQALRAPTVFKTGLVF